MSRINYLGAKPTQIRPTLAEYLSPTERSETLTGGKVFKTNWTRKMLERLLRLSRLGLQDPTILEMMKEEFGAPETVREIMQERAFMGMGKFARNNHTCLGWAVTDFLSLVAV